MNISLALLSALFLYLNFRRNHLNHRNVGSCQNPVFWLSKWGQSCWTQYLCQVNYLVVLCAFCGEPNTTKKRMLVCAFFSCQYAQAPIYHTVQLTAVSNHRIAGLSHDLSQETRGINCHCSHLATAWVCPPAEASSRVKPINFGCRLGASVGLFVAETLTQSTGTVLRSQSHLFFPSGSPECPAGTPRAATVSHGIPRLLMKNTDEAFVLHTQLCQHRSYRLLFQRQLLEKFAAF